MTKEEILNKTQAGLAVFRHFVPADWIVGKNFRNPFYDDKKASCNIYFDKNTHQYKIKDFGDLQYNGDCFSLVALLNGFDVRTNFAEVLDIIVQEMVLDNHRGAATPQKPKAIQKISIPEETTSSDFEVITKPFSESELRYWKQFGIGLHTLKKYHVASVSQFSATNKQGKNYCIMATDKEPIFGYVHKHFTKLYRPQSEQRFQFLGNKPETYIFGLDYLMARGDVLFITGGEKDVLSLSAKGFSAICFNSENANIPPEVVKKLSYRFRHIVLLYDVDRAGVEATIHHLNALKELDIKHLTLPLNGTKQEKDVSDYFRIGKTSEDLKKLFNQLLDNLYSQTFAMLRSCEIDFGNPPITPKPLITISGVTIGSPGNLLGITGNEGSGKSNFLGGMLAGALAKPAQVVDSLGTRVLPNHSGKSVLYFDTEQSEDQLYRNLNIVLQRCELASPPEWFKAYCLTNLSRRERLQVILQSVDNRNGEPFSSSVWRCSFGSH